MEQLLRKHRRGMELRTIALKTRLYIIAVIILFLGVGAAGIIYFTADNTPNNMVICQLENSKMYRHNLELFGGKFSIIVDDFFRWFDRLWHGRALASTVISITLFIFLIFTVAAYNLSPELNSVSEENNHDRT
jgi:hypothetical protein